MASFTDQLLTFNPFVPTLPVDAMVQVGMQKQQKYEENVQKIQTEIDNIAGLDISRPQDKAYLQSKLNELGNNLNSVAAGDFSNFQLVNSVSGMTKQIVKDPTITNAISSTAWYKKQKSLIESLRKEGKSSTQNEAWFNEDVNKWFNDPKAGALFSSEFTQYTDIDKKLRDVADKIHELDNSIENPYRRDNSGNTLYYKRDPKTGQTSVSTDPNSGGVPQIDDAILAIKTKGKPAEKILAAFYDSLTEDDMRQLKIDGWYHYRGATKDKFKNDITTDYNNNKKNLSESLINLNLELTTNTKLNDAEKSALQAKITQINNKLTDGSLDKDYRIQLSKIDQLNNNDELTDFKYKLYTQKHLSNVANDIAYQSIQQEYKNNPYAQRAHERRELQFKYDDANRRHQEFLQSLDQSERHWMADYTYKITKDAQDAAGSKPIVTPDRLPTDVDTPDLFKLDKEIKGIIGKDGQIAQLDAQYAKLITAPNITDKKKYLDGLADSYSKDPSFINGKDINANMKEYLRKRRALDILASQKQLLYTSTENASAEFDKKLNDVFANDNNIIDKKTGKTIFSAREIYEVARDVSNFKVGSDFAYDAFLQKYKGTKKEAIAKVYYKMGLNQEAQRTSYRTPSAELSPIEKSIWSIGSSTLNNRNSDVSKINKEKLIFQSNYLAQRMPERQTATGTLSKDNKVDMDHVDQLLGKKEIEYSEGGLDVNAKKDYDPTVVATLRQAKNVSYSVRKKYDGTADFIITSGSSKQTIPLTAEEFSAYFPNYAKVNSINDIKYAVLASPNKTTNLSGVTDGSAAINAYLTGESLPQLAGTPLANLVRVDVDGSPFNDGSNNDKFIVRMYVNDNGVWKTRTLNSEYINEATLDYYLKNIGSATVNDVLQGK